MPDSEIVQRTFNRIERHIRRHHARLAVLGLVGIRSRDDVHSAFGILVRQRPDDIAHVRHSLPVPVAARRPESRWKLARTCTVVVLVGNGRRQQSIIGVACLLHFAYKLLSVKFLRCKFRVGSHFLQHGFRCLLQMFPLFLNEVNGAFLREIVAFNQNASRRAD